MSSKDSINYIQNVVSHSKNTDITVDDCLQMFLAYKHINSELHLYLSSSNDKLTIENLIETVNVQKNI